METREPGWYPDPWGTDDERWFDGGAWTPRVRAPGAEGTQGGGADLPDDATGPTGAAPVGVMAGPAAVGSSAPAPGWFADPWKQASWRWWDGSGWTGYTDVPASGATVVGRSAAEELSSERESARWVRVALAIHPLFQVVGLVGASIQYRWLADHLDEFGSGTSPPGAPAAAQLLQYFGLPAIATLIFLVLWLYRAGATARALGNPMRRKPGLGALSLLIPIVNFWWPYRAARDALGADHGSSAVVVRWWAAWIAFAFASLAVLGAAFLPELFSILAVAIGAVLAVIAAVWGRAMVSAVLVAHEQAVAAGSG